MDEKKQRSLDAKDAYEAIAPVYDAFTAGYDFDLWINQMLPKLEEQGLKGDRLLDIGCGTGRSLLAMVERGWIATACDISPAMVKIAETKLGERAEFYVADMRDLPTFGAFDLIWALDDAVNYLLSKAELEEALTKMRRNLADGGMIVFDLNTARVYRTFFAERVVVDDGGRHLIWEGLGGTDFKVGGLASARFHESPINQTGPSIPAHIHRQRHFPMETVLSAMGATGLNCSAVFGHEDDAIPNPHLDEEVHTKAVYVAKAI